MVNITFWTSQRDCKHFVEVGTKDSAVCISIDFWQPQEIFREWSRFAVEHLTHPDLVMLYEYLKESGRIINMTADIADKTIQYLKETN